MSTHDDILLIGNRATLASRELSLLNSRRKNAILEEMATEIDKKRDAILEANSHDIDAAINQGLSPAMIDRLKLDNNRINAMIKGIQILAALKDPIGTRLSRWIRPNGLVIIKKRVPIGVIAIIYESRPNVTADTAAICIKTSNAVILRGGKEALYSNIAISDAMIAGGRRKGLPEHAIQFVRITDHNAVKEIVQLEGKVDLVIPRGGESLIRAVVEQARVPVIKHYKGVCHVFVDAAANQDMAMAIVENAKCQRPGVCNAMETLLIHEAIAPVFLPRIAARLTELKVELRGDETSRKIVPLIKEATEADWSKEYLDLILAIRVVPSVEAAIDHINTYGTHHSDAIVTENEVAANMFCERVDSAVVYVNASTRFTDGGEFGMGTEIGISTDKLHARGPMGLEELTTYKFIVYGSGQIRK